MNTHTISTDRHDAARFTIDDHAMPLRRLMTAFVVVLALALGLLGPAVQPAEAQVRGFVRTDCTSSLGQVRVTPQTNASHHVVILRRWDGQKWVASDSHALGPSNPFLTARFRPGYYRIDVLAWTPASGWQQVSPVYYRSFRQQSSATLFMANTSYCRLL